MSATKTALCDNRIEVWYVQGDDTGVGDRPTLFTSKIAAELYARLLFPDEAQNTRDARIHYHTVYALHDVYV